MPFMKFYPGDWLQSADLRLASLAARGLWIELLCHMHQANPRGYLLISGNSPTVAQIARMCGSAPEEVENLLSELDQLGVLSRENGVIVNRRMAREGDISAIRSAAGSHGGRPSCGTRKAKRKQNESKPQSKTKAKVSGDEKQNESKDEKQTESKPLASSFFVTFGNKSAATTCPLPPELDNAEFSEAYQRFADSRRDARRPLTAHAVELQLRELAQWSRTRGIDYAIAAVNQSTKNQWQGIFEPKGQQAVAPNLFQGIIDA